MFFLRFPAAKRSYCVVIVDEAFVPDSMVPFKGKNYKITPNNDPPSMPSRSNVSVRFHIDRDVADYVETSSRRRNRYVNETDLFETSLGRLIGT